MTTGRADFLMILLPNGQVLAAGSGGNSTSAELYNPTTGTWTATGDTQSQLFGDAVVLLQNGEVYAPSPPVGGASSPIALLQNGDVWTAGDVNGESLYDPSTTSGPRSPRRRARRSRKVARVLRQRSIPGSSWSRAALPK